MYIKTDRFLRMANVLSELAKPEGSTVKKLAMKLSYSEKSIHSILEDIIDLEIPVCSEKAINEQTSTKRYFLKKEYVDRFIQFLPLLIRLTPDEQFLLKYLLEKDTLLTNTGLIDSINTLRLKLDKLILCDTREVPSRLHTSCKHRRSYQGIETIITKLMNAVRTKTEISVSYQKANQDALKAFALQAYSIVDYNGALYIVGCNIENGSIHTYAADRFHSAEISIPEVTFDIPTGFSAERYLEGSFAIVDDGKQQKYKILFSKSAMNAIYMRKWGNEQAIQENDDGSFFLSFTSSGEYDIRTWVLSFGADAEVIEPKKFRENIRDELVRSLSVYQ